MAVAFLMIETAKANLEKVKTKLASVRDKQRMLSVKNALEMGLHKKSHLKTFTLSVYVHHYCVRNSCCNGMLHHA